MKLFSNRSDVRRYKDSLSDPEVLKTILNKEIATSEKRSSFIGEMLIDKGTYLPERYICRTLTDGSLEKLAYDLLDIGCLCLISMGYEVDKKLLWVTYSVSDTNGFNLVFGIEGAISSIPFVFDGANYLIGNNMVKVSLRHSVDIDNIVSIVNGMLTASDIVNKNVKHFSVSYGEVLPSSMIGFTNCRKKNGIDLRFKDTKAVTGVGILLKK